MVASRCAAPHVYKLRHFPGSLFVLCYFVKIQRREYDLQPNVKQLTLSISSNVYTYSDVQIKLFDTKVLTGVRRTPNELIAQFFVSDIASCIYTHYEKKSEEGMKG